MKLPSEVSPGQSISAKDFNNLVRFVQSLQINTGPGIYANRSLGGTSIRLAPQEQRPPGLTSIEHPFLVTSTSSATVAMVSVKAGTVNDMEPSNKETNLTLTSAGQWRVYLDCTISVAGTITAAVLNVTSGSQPADTNTHAYITLAIATVSAISGGFTVDDINQMGTHSLRFYACGRVVTDGVVTTKGTYNFWGF